MNFQQTVETILTWINSCTSRDQLNLCQDAIDGFIRDRYRNHIPQPEFFQAESKLGIAIMDKEFSFLTTNNSNNMQDPNAKKAQDTDPAEDQAASSADATEQKAEESPNEDQPVDVDEPVSGDGF